MSHPNSPQKSVQQSQHSNQSPQHSKYNQLQQLVLANQNFSSQYRGFYTIQQWRKLNNLLFTPNQHQQKTTITNCWRLLKLINFGDDIIPTGLIYDCIMTLMNVDQTVQQTQTLIKSIFLKFIQINGKHLTPKERQQLQFFKIVRIVVQGFRKIIAEKLEHQEEIVNGNNDNNNDGKQRLYGRNQQLYLLHGVMTYKRDLERLKKIEAEFKSCSFQPKINQKSQQIGESRYLASPKRKQKDDSPLRQVQSHCIAIDQSQEFIDSSRASQHFKAKPLPQYPQHSPSREYTDHIERMQKSRQIKSINSLSRRYQSSSSSNTKEFSIQERDEFRKKNLFSNIKILFMIKVEVGKRIYRVKVRENMGVAETVMAIEKMVGFRNSQIVNVVKGYFMNWERREKEKSDCNIVNGHSSSVYGS